MIQYNKAILSIYCIQLTRLSTNINIYKLVRLAYFKVRSDGGGTYKFALKIICFE